MPAFTDGREHVHHTNDNAPAGKARGGVGMVDRQAVACAFLASTTRLIVDRLALVAAVT